VNDTPAVEPYSRFAAEFDEILGDRFFPQMQRVFEWLERRHGLRYSSVADVGCGTGTFLAYLGGRGVETLWGVDRSPQMLARAIEKNATNGARFLRQDLRRLHLPQHVDLLTCQFDTLNYVLSDADLHTALTAFADGLVPGGHALFDVVTARLNTPGRDERLELARNEGRTVTLSTRYDASQRLQTASLLVADGAGSHREEHLQRAYAIADVVDALDGSGLELLAVHDFSNLDGPVGRAERVVFIARAGPEGRLFA